MFKEKFLSSQETSKQTSAELPKDQRNDGVTTTDLELPELPDRLLHPNRYIGDGDGAEQILCSVLDRFCVVCCVMNRHKY